MATITVQITDKSADETAVLEQIVKGQQAFQTAEEIFAARLVDELKGNVQSFVQARAAKASAMWMNLIENLPPEQLKAVTDSVIGQLKAAGLDTTAIQQFRDSLP